MEKLFNLQLFANENNPTLNVNKTSDATSAEGGSTANTLKATMKTFYNTSLLENARNEHYYNQFGMKQGLPKNGGNKVEWRKFSTYAPATSPLTEGVTPDGNKVSITKIEKAISQYGDYTTVSDRLELEAVDPIITGVTEEHGAQAGDTLELITRAELLTNTNQRTAGDKQVSALSSTDTITATLINKAVTDLKKAKAPTINGDYVAVIHPSVAYDLRESQGWLDAHKYAQPDEIYNGEIGKLHGVRFVESTMAPVEISGAAINNPPEGTNAKHAVYHTFIFGKDAFGIIEPSAESLEVIVKQRGSAGTSDPLDQRSTVGWKASHAAKMLYPERMVDVITSSSFSATDTDIVPAS